MKTYDASIITEKAKSAITTFWLVEFLFTDATEVRYTDADIHITYDGDTFHPAPLQINGIRSTNGSPLDGCSLNIGNVDNVLSDYVLQNSIRNAVVNIYEVFLDAANTIIDAPVLVFAGKVSGRPALTEQWCAIDVSPHKNPWTSRFPRRRITRSCGWLFKSASCGYAGTETSCNKTWERCSSTGPTGLDNATNFGGFRMILKPGTTFVWGKTQITIK